MRFHIPYIYAIPCCENGAVYSTAAVHNAAFYISIILIADSNHEFWT